MMDFNQILLFAGLGLLALVLLFALWGFLGGLKRELKCIAVFIVLLVLSWLVLGDAATILNVEAGQQLAEVLDIKDNSISTIWDLVVAYAKTIIPNGESLLVEGKETYDLLHSIVSAVCRAAGLLVGTIVVLVICPIIRLLSHLIGLIIKLFKLIFAKKKVKEAATNDAPKANEQVVVPSTESGFEEAVITKDKNEVVKKPAGKRRLWGAFAATLKGVFVVILICAPLSGLTSILNSVSPKTQELISDLVSGDAEFKVSQSDDPLEMVFDFAEAYDESALGKFANASGFFFGESFSEGLFDQLLKIETKTQTIYLTEEIGAVVNAVNQLNGKTDLTQLTKTEFSNVIEALKDSKLVIEVMPVAIEYAYSIEDIRAMLSDAKQENAFLALRYNNWRHDIDSVLDAVKEAYDLKLFPISDFNYLTLDPEELRDVVNHLGETELMQDALPIGLAVALSMEDIKNLVGEVVVSMDDYDVKKELNSIVDIYAKFQKFGITSFDGFDSDAFVKDVLTSDELTDLVFEIVNDVIDLQLIQKLAVPLAFGFAENNEALVKMLEDAGQYDNFFALEQEFTLEDLKVYVETVHIALDLMDFSEYPTIKFDYFHLDADKLDEVVDNLFSSEVTSKLFNLAVEVAISMESVKEATNGALEEIDLSVIDWHNELGLIVDIYRSFLELGFESAEDLQGDMIDLVQEILEDEVKFEAVANILDTLATMDIYQILAVPAVQGVVDKLIDEKYASFSNIIGLTDLSVDEWKEDFRTILELAKDVNELKVLDNLDPFDYTQLDIASQEGVDNIKAIISAILNLNILGDDESKTKLLFASINQFGWAILPENSEEIVFDWANEEAVLLQLVDVYKNVNDLEEFDIFAVGETDWVELLESDAFLDHVVTALEALVESDIALELIPGLLDKYLMPILEGTDVGDDTLFRDILSNVESEELVNEIIKLVDVVKAAIDLNLLNAKSEGLGAIDLANTEALKTIISGIFDSKLIKGYEGRIIRIALKLTGILDIEKDSDLYNELVSLDYTGEKEVLLAFIDTIAPVLQDPEFSLVDANGKLVLDLVFWAENEHAKTLLEGIEVLFGSYEDEGYEGSKLIETLLPSIYDKFIEEGNLIPADFEEIVEILEVSDASGAELTNLLRCLVYIVEELVALDAQSLMDPKGGNMEISTEAAVQGFTNIIVALHDIELFKGHESEALAWIVNYVGKSLNIDIEATVHDFSNVDWEQQQFAYIEIIEDLAEFLANNEIETLKDLVLFVKDGKLTATDFITKENAIAVLDILDKIIDLEVIDAIAPLLVKYGVKVIGEAGLDLSYINDLSNEELASDLHGIVAIAHKLVEETNIIDIINSDFAGELPLPEEEVIVSIVDDLFGLNIVNKAEGKLLNAILGKVLPESLFLTVEDFDAENIDWSLEKEFIKDLVRTVYDLLEVNNIVTVSSLRSLINEKWYTYPTVLRDETGYVIVNVLRVLQESQIVANIIEKSFDYGIEQLNGMNLPIDLSVLAGMSKDSLIEDLGTIANILDDAIEFGALRYVADKEIRNMDLEILAGIVEQLYDLNIIAENDADLIKEIYSYALETLGNILNTNLEISSEEMANASLEYELDVLANVVRSLQGVFDGASIQHSSDIEQILRTSEYKTKDFYTEETFDALVEVVRAATDLHFIELIASQLFEFGINKAVDAGFNFSYMLDGQYETELLLEDLDIILDIVKHAHDLGLMDYVFDKTLHTINLEPLCDIVDEAVEMNLAELYFHTTVTKTVNYIFRKLNLEVSVTEEEVLKEVALLGEAETFKAILGSAQELLDVNELVSLDDVLAFVKEKQFATAEFFDVETGKVLEALITNVASLKTVELILPDLLDVAINKVEQFDLSFLTDEFTGAQLAQEVKTIAKLIVPAIEAELVGLAFGKSIDELPLHFEKYVEMLSVVQQSIILNEKYANFAEILLNELLAMLNASGAVTEVECRGLDFAQEVEQIKLIVNSLGVICAENNIETVKSVKNFVAEKLYQRADFFTVSLGAELENIITSVANLGTLQIILPNIFDKYVGGIQQVDLSFLVGEFSGVELAEDLKVIAKLIVPAIEADLVKVLFKAHYKDVNINFEKYDELLSIIKDLNILNDEYAEIVELAANKVLEMIKIEKTVPASVFEGISFASEIDLVREALNGLEAAFEAAELVTVNDVLTLINEKQYTEASFYTVEVGQGLADFISGIAEVETVKVMLPRILNYGIDKLSSTIDLSFIKNTLTSEELAEDVQSIASLIVPAIKAGLVEVILTKNVDSLELEFDIYDEMLAIIGNMNIINKQYPSVAAMISNYILKALNIEAEITKDDLLDASFAVDVDAIRSILSGLKAICAENSIETVEGAKTFIKNKIYQRADFFTLTVGEGLENVLTNAANISFAKEILAEVLDTYVAKVTQVDLSFLVGAFSDEELAEDVKTIAQVVVPAIEADLVKALFKAHYKEAAINFEKYDEILDIVKELNIANKKYADIVSLAINQVIEMLNINESVKPSDFADISYASEIDILKAVIDGVEQLFTIHNYESIGNVLDAVNGKEYLESEFYDVETGAALEHIISSFVDSETVLVMLPRLFNYGIDKVSGTLDVSFLRNELTGAELAEDIKALASLIVPAINATLNELADIEDRAGIEFHFDIYDQMLDVVKELNIINKKYPNLAALAVNKVLSVLGVNEEVTAEELSELTFAAEIENIKGLLDNVEALFNEKGYVAVRDIRDMLTNKEYLESEFYTVGVGSAMEAIIGSLVDLDLVEVILPYVFDKYVGEFNAVDLSFLVGEFTGAELAQDIKTIAKLIVPAIEATLNNVADRENIADIEFHFDIYDQMLDILAEVNILKEFTPEFAALAINKVLSALGIEEEVTENDCANVTIADEFAAIKAVLENVEQIFNEKGYVCVRDVLSAHANKDLFEGAYYTETVGQALAGIISNIADLEIAEIVLPYVFDKYIGQVSQVDLSFLVGEFTGAELVEDIKTVSELIVPAINTNIVFAVLEQTYGDILVDAESYKAMLTSVSNLNVLNKKYSYVAQLAANTILKTLGIDLEIAEAEFANASLAADVQSLCNLIDAIAVVCEENDIDTVYYVTVFVENKLYQTVDFFSVATGQALEDTITNAISLSFVHEILAEVFDTYVEKVTQIDLSFLVGEFTDEELAQDVNTIANIIVPAIEAELVKALFKGYLNEVELNFAKYDEILDNIKVMNILNKKYAELADIAVDKALGILGIEAELSADDFRNISFAAEIERLQEVLVHVEKLCSVKGYVTAADVKSIISDKAYKQADFYDVATGEELEHIICSVVESETLQVLLPVVFDWAISKVNVIDLSYLEGELSSDELVADIKNIAGLIVPAIEHEMISSVLKYLVKEYEIDEARIDAIANIVDVVLSLNIVRENPAQLIYSVLDKLGVDATDVELGNIDWDNEEAVAVSMVKEIANGLLEYNLTSLNAVYSYIKGLLSDINVNNIISELKSIYNTINVEHCVSVVESIDQSDLFDELFKPLYNKFVFDKVSGILGDAADLTEYSKADLSDDVHSMAVVARSLLNIKEIPGSIKDNYNHPECVANLEVVVLELFSLNYLEQKKFALLELAEKASGLDLSLIDLNNVNFEEDGVIFASLVSDAIEIYDLSDRFSLQIAQLGITELMSTVVYAYQDILEANLVKELIYWAYETYGRNVLANIPNFKDPEFSKTNVLNIATDLGITLEALLDMGLFSNNGIDFTNRENTDRLFVILENNFNYSDEMAKNINNVKENMYEYGIIPLSYAGISNFTETRAFSKAYEAIKAFAEKYANIANDLNVIATEEFQVELQDCVKAIFRSDILDQILLPLASGTVKVVTKDVVKLTILDDITSDELVNVVLPELYGMIEHVQDLGLLDLRLYYRNTEAMISLLDAIKDSTFFGGHTEELVKFALFYAGIDVRGVDFSSVVWEDEVEYLKLALTRVDSQLENIELADKNTFLTSESIYALSRAVECFEESKLLPLVFRKLVEVLVEKTLGNSYPEYIDRLYAVDYTDEVLMSDYARLDEILAIFASTDFFTTGVDLNELDPYVELLEIFFELEYSNGMEETVIKAVLAQIDNLKDYEVDYSKVTDWESEDNAIIEVAHEFLEFSKLVHINSITSDDLHKEEVQDQVVDLVDALSRSIIGQQLLPRLYKDYIEPGLGSDDYDGIIDLENTQPEDWAGEFEKLFAMYNIVSIHGFHDDYSSAEVLELVKIMFGDSASNEGLISVNSDPEAWFKKVFDNETVSMPEGNVTVNYDNVEDWDAETQNIVAVVEAMDAFQTEGEAFDYENVYTSNDATALEGLMTAVNESASLQSAMYQVVVNAANDESNAVLKGNLNALQNSNGETIVDIDALAADLEDDGIISDTNKWTEEEIALIAATIADFNA